MVSQLKHVMEHYSQPRSRAKVANIDITPCILPLHTLDDNLNRLAILQPHSWFFELRDICVLFL